MPLRLSVLDQSPVAEGSTGARALQDTLDLARLADALGYHRYWVAEHHGGPALAGPAPEVLIGRSVSLHPLTVVLGVGVGAALLGIAGSFLATPVMAAVGAAAGWIDPEGADDG